jgi:hypothetical protein
MVASLFLTGAVLVAFGVELGVPLIAGSVFGAVFYAATIVVAPYVRYSRNPDLGAEYEVEVGQEGMSFKGAGAATTYTWERVSRVETVGDTLLVFVAPKYANLVPVRTDTTELVNAIREHHAAAHEVERTESSD